MYGFIKYSCLRLALYGILHVSDHIKCMILQQTSSGSDRLDRLVNYVNLI